MPTNRSPIARTWRPGRFSAEVLDLFTRLEATPVRERWKSGSQWVDDSKRLAVLLDLSTEWWAMQNVHDRDRGSDYEPGSLGHQAWQRCRAMRKQLLEAVRERESVAHSATTLTSGDERTASRSDQ